MSSPEKIAVISTTFQPSCTLLPLAERSMFLEENIDMLEIISRILVNLFEFATKSTNDASLSRCS
jgi:hypothetical protein